MIVGQDPEPSKLVVPIFLGARCSLQIAGACQDGRQKATALRCGCIPVAKRRVMTGP